MPNCNPMNLTWPIVPSSQPGAVTQGSYDLTGDRMTCPICSTDCRRIGSTNFDWRCDQGHQFEFPVPGQPGVALFLGATGTIVAMSVLPVGIVRDPRSYL
jgi:hypothetical protein